jgi:RNA polymerase sigma-70 factor (ECF subfamily)
VNITSAQVEKQVMQNYTTALYEACRQTQDLERRERAYSELHRLLFRAAYNRWPELAEDATKRALVLVYEQIDRCRSPGAFVAFALGKLRHAFQQEQRARGRELPLEKKTEKNAGGTEQATPPSLLIKRERRQTLLDSIAQLPNKRQQQTIILKYFAGLSDEAIGARLGLTANHVRVLRHRGMKQLRQDERLDAL